MTADEFAALAHGQAVRVKKSGKIYRVETYSGIFFRQVRLDGKVGNTPAIRLNAASIERAPEHDKKQGDK